jgi:hypothetical protein
MVARSNAEAECRAMAHTATELTLLQHFLQDIGFLAPTPILLSCDNQATIHIASNLVFHERLNILRSIVIMSETKYSKEIYLHHS